MYVGPAISGMLHLGLLALALAPSYPDPIAPIDSGPPVEVELMTLNEYNAALSRSPKPNPSAPGAPEEPSADLAMNTPPPPTRPARPAPVPDGVTLTAPPEEAAPEPDIAPERDNAVQALATPPAEPFVDERALQDKPISKNDILPKEKVRVAGVPEEPEQPRGVYDAPEIETDPDEPPEQQLVEREDALPSSTDVADATAPRREVPPKNAPIPRPKPRGSLASESSDEEKEVAAASAPDADALREEERIAAEDARLEEEDRLAAEREKAERLAAEEEEQREIEEERLAAEEEEQRRAEEERLAEIEEAKRAAEEELAAQRAAEEEQARRLAEIEEEKRRKEEERQAALEEEKRKQEEAEIAALAEEKRKLEEELKRQREQEELARLAQEKLLAEQRAAQELMEQQRLQQQQAALAQQALAEQYRREQEALAQIARQQQLQQLNSGSTLNQQTEQSLGVGTPTPNAPPADPFATMMAGLDTQYGSQSGSGFDGRTFSRSVAAQQNAPPLTQGEQQNFLNQLSNCWALGSIGANIPVVEMRASFTSDGRVSNVTVISAPPGAQLAVERAMNALRDQSCQPFVLPKEKYASWQQFDIVFDPRRMSVR